MWISKKVLRHPSLFPVLDLEGVGVGGIIGMSNLLCESESRGSPILLSWEQRGETTMAREKPHPTWHWSDRRAVVQRDAGLNRFKGTLREFSKHMQCNVENSKGPQFPEGKKGAQSAKR